MAAGQFLNRRFLLRVIIAGGLIAAGALYVTTRRAATTPAPTPDHAAQTKPLEAPVELTNGAAGSYQDRMQKPPPPPPTPDTSALDALRLELAGLRQDREQDRQERERLQAEIDALKQKPPGTPKVETKAVASQPKPTVKPGDEAAKRAAAERRAALTAPLAAMRDDQTKDETDDTKGKRIMPESPYHLIAGTPVNCRLDTPINSEHPVPVVGLVTAPVYDTMTGTLEVIPQYAKLIGSYRQVLLGDATVTVSWESLEFPADGSRIPLDGQPGGDHTGQAGLPGEVDHKWGTSLFAMLTNSVTSASTSMTSAMVDSTAGRAAAMAGQNLLQQGGRQLTRTLNVQPTIYVAYGTPCSMNLKSALNMPPAVRR